MGQYIRSYSDPDLGAIAEVVDDETGEVVATGAASPRKKVGDMEIVDESWTMSGPIDPAAWAAAVRSTQT